MTRVSHGIRIIRAAALVHQRGEVLADFEIETIQTVRRRLGDKGIPCVVTPAEWQVIDDAVAAMERAPRQDLTDAGLAA